MKIAEEIMNILEAYDLTRSFRDAAELAGCSHHTVARYVKARDAGCLSATGLPRPQLIDDFLPKVEQWMESSKGKIRADVAHDKLLAMGFTGSSRTTRRAVARVRRNWKAGRLRVFRPWVTEPGMWMQYDFGDGPTIGGVRTTLFCAWLAWSRFRVVIALRDKTAPSVFAALDMSFRLFGGVPTYALTDNEKTVTVEHVAGIAVRNPGVVVWSRHYGVTVATCEPADPASKGGSESTVKLAKADLVPTDTNLLPAYESFAELEAACEAFCDQVNTRVHRITRRAPVDMLAEEVIRLHRVPETPATASFGVTRRVPANTPMVSFDAGAYSVPHQLVGQSVWVRVRGLGQGGEQVVIVHVGADGRPVEVARHDRATPGSPRIDDAHFPPQPAGALNRTPRPRTAEEVQFCAIGDGARLWLVEAGAAGATRVRRKMAQAVALSKLHTLEQVDWALGHAALHGRFAEADLASILEHSTTATAGPRLTADEAGSLAQGTTKWAALGQETP